LRRIVVPRRATLTLLSALLLCGLPGTTGAARKPSHDSAEQAERAARAAALAAELRAARSHKLYLVLDPAASHLELKADGLLLHRFPVESAQLGRSRLAGGEVAWPAAAFTLVSELDERERPKIPIQPIQTQDKEPDATNPAGATSTRVSAAREEALADAPTHYRLRFVPTLDVSVLGEAGVSHLPGRVWRVRHRLVEGWEAVYLRLRGKPVPPRVVLTMTPREARRLFLVLLPETRLVIAAAQPTP
jgi:hypothetical protein